MMKIIFMEWKLWLYTAGIRLGYNRRDAGLLQKGRTNHDRPDRNSDTAAIHSRMLRMQCMLELLEQPLFPHAANMYLPTGTLYSAYTVKSGILNL